MWQAGVQQKWGAEISHLLHPGLFILPSIHLPHPLCPALSERLTSDLHGQHPQAAPPLASVGFGHQGHQQESRGKEEGEADVYSHPSLLRALDSGRFPLPPTCTSAQTQHTHILNIHTTQPGSDDVKFRSLGTQEDRLAPEKMQSEEG